MTFYRFNTKTWQRSDLIYGVHCFVATCFRLFPCVECHSILAHLARLRYLSYNFRLNYLPFLEASPGTSRQNHQIFLCVTTTPRTHVYWYTDLRVLNNCVHVCLSPLQKPNVDYPENPGHSIVICSHVHKLLQGRVWVSFLPRYPASTRPKNKLRMPGRILGNKAKFLSLWSLLCSGREK